MGYTNVEKLIFDKEHEMWKAASNRDVKAFQELVADDAIMICGGYRCLGAEYAGYIKDFYVDEYEIHNEEVVFSSDDAIQIHYVINVKSNSQEYSDLAGIFHVVSLWKKNNDVWKLIFNMDSRIIIDNE
jgi:hypothetical protein